MIPAHIEQISVDVVGDKNSDEFKRTITELCRSLESKISKTFRIISLDGMDGAGKTTIGRALAEATLRTFIDIDDYLEKNQGVYRDAIDRPRLTIAIKETLIAQRPVVVSGCLVEQILEDCGFKSDYKIYVMRLSGMISNPEYEFIDEYEILYGEDSADVIFEHEGISARKFAELNGYPIPENDEALPNLERELIRYHKERKPHDFADIILKIIRRA